MTPWCWWPCAGMWTRKSKAREANGRWSPLWSSLLLKVKTSANDMLVFLRDQTQSESCRLPRSWCLQWMKKSGETSAMPKNNTMRRWVRPIINKRTEKRCQWGRRTNSRLFRRHRTCRFCATPSRLSEKQPSNRKSCIRTRLSNWHCSWRTLNCTKSRDVA